MNVIAPLKSFSKLRTPETFQVEMCPYVFCAVLALASQRATAVLRLASLNVPLIVFWSFCSASCPALVL